MNFNEIVKFERKKKKSEKHGVDWSESTSGSRGLECVDGLRQIKSQSEEQIKSRAC